MLRLVILVVWLCPQSRTCVLMLIGGYDSAGNFSPNELTVQSLQVKLT